MAADADGWIKLDMGREALWLRLDEVAAVWREPPAVRVALRGTDRTFTIPSSQLNGLLIALIAEGP